MPKRRLSPIRYEPSLCGYHNAAITSRLIAAKSKVAPLTPMTVPRLELIGAILGLRLTQSLLTVLEAPMQSVTFYSDSTDVLWWIRGRGKDFRPFVPNRIGEIQMFSEPSQWQHVLTEENPADLCTRGATPSELADSPLWWNGPDWLTKDFKEWSKMQDPNRPREMPEKKTSQRKEDTNGCTTLLTNNLQKEAASKQDDKLGVWRLDPKRFSSWIRLLRVHARVRRVLLNMRRRDNRNARMELLPEEIKDAEEEIVRLAQREAFCEEYTALRSGKPISKKSQLIKLNPCIDEDGIIRCDGRLKFADFLPYDTRFQIILPRGHWVTKLIAKNHHERGNHAAVVNFTLCQLSERFWIIAAREKIREWDRECNECKRRRSKPACQIMAPLPKARLRFTFKTLRSNSRRFCKTLVHRSRPQKTATEKVAVPFYLLGNTSSAFRDGLGTRYRHILKRVHSFYQSLRSSYGSDKRQGHEFRRCSGRIKETSQPARPTTTSDQDSRTWSNVEIQSTRCPAFWRSPGSAGKSC